MKPLLLILLLSAFAAAEDKSPCLIVSHASTSRQMWVSSASFVYVEGDFPPGMKFKSNIRDKTVRKVKEAGGRIVTLVTNYTTADLEDARKQCKDAPPAK